MTQTSGFRLPADIGTRLANLAKKTGRSKTYYASKAIEEFLNQQETLLLALAEIETQQSPARPQLADVLNKIKLGTGG